MNLKVFLFLALTFTVNVGATENVPASPESALHTLSLEDDLLFKYLEDPENRVSEMFKVSKHTAPFISFWFLIYTKYSTFHSVFFDEDHPEIILNVVDGTEYFKRGFSPIVQEILFKKKIDLERQKYKKALAAISNNFEKKYSINSLENKLLAIYKSTFPTNYKKILKGSSNRLRSQLGQRDKILHGIERADRFMIPMENIFKENNIPFELTRIPLVESSFNTTAISKADAVGPWQFIKSSATEFLTVNKNNGIDERLSPIKASLAAAKLFKRHHKILGDWYLTVISYNHGLRTFLKDKRKFQKMNISQLLRNSKNNPLGFASRNYLSEFIALLHAEKYADKLYGFKRGNYSNRVDILRLSSPKSVYDLSIEHKISLLELKIYNPDVFDFTKKLLKGTRVVIPRSGNSRTISSIGSDEKISVVDPNEN